MNLLQFFEDINVRMDKGSRDVMHLYFQRACDMGLKGKLEAHGIEGRVLDWIDTA